MIWRQQVENFKRIIKDHVFHQRDGQAIAEDYDWWYRGWYEETTGILFGGNYYQLGWRKW